ncbi:MAG: D-aminoacyl-tRNA deacylase [Saprospiraceae bacterium]
MRLLIQRVTRASVTVNNTVTGQIGTGLLVLVGIGTEDDNDDIDWLVGKLKTLRVFNDEEGKTNLDISDVDGSFLVVSQFTLHASTKKGNRPGFLGAARPEAAIPLYERFCKLLAVTSGRDVQTGEFGADMQVELVNDGPVTIWIDSRNRE